MSLLYVILIAFAVVHSNEWLAVAAAGLFGINLVRTLYRNRRLPIKQKEEPRAKEEPQIVIIRDQPQQASADRGPNQFEMHLNMMRQRSHDNGYGTTDHIPEELRK